MFGVIHLGGMIFLSIYGFITPLQIIDNIFIVTIISLPLSWMACNNECIISYLLKKHKNPEYILGSEPNIDDITELFPNKLSYEIFFHMNHVIRILSFATVLERNEYNVGNIWYVIYTIYVYNIRYKFLS